MWLFRRRDQLFVDDEYTTSLEISSPIIHIFCLLISTISFGQKKKEKKVKVEQPAKQIIREGNNFYNNSNFSEAEDQYRKALEIIGLICPLF